jgi:hypothetical protein
MSEQLRQPADTRRIRNSAIRYGAVPRWVATYTGSYHGGLQEGARRVGLYVPRPTPQNPNGHSVLFPTDTGDVTEHPIGVTPTGSHGAWWTAHATELPREQRQAIRAHWNTLQNA